MSLERDTRRAYRAAYMANRMARAVSNPGRYARQRAKSRALGAVGFWRVMGRFWRA